MGAADVPPTEALPDKERVEMGDFAEVYDGKGSKGSMGVEEIESVCDEGDGACCVSVVTEGKGEE